MVWFAPSAAVGVGFYGNSETNDGVSQMTHSLESANNTFSGIRDLVRLEWQQAGWVLWGQGGWRQGPPQA